MTTEKDATQCSEAWDRKPYMLLGAGSLTASVQKSGSEEHGWRYCFNVHRTCERTGKVSQWFTPQDVGDFAKLTYLLAFTLADDGCMDAGLRDDLLCLASCLEQVTPSDFATFTHEYHPRESRRNGHAANH